MENHLNSSATRFIYLLVFDLGSRGPSTVTLMALLYVVIMGGLVDTVIVNVKLLPAKITKRPNTLITYTKSHASSD